MMSKIILDVKNITVSFSGFVAINNFSLQLEKWGLNFLIGPNGAGKTTLLDVICGKTKVKEGELIFKEVHNLSKLKEYQITNKGVGRKFQAPSIFKNLSVRENLLITASEDKGLFASMDDDLSREDEEHMEEILELTGLESVVDLMAGTLAHGQKQWLEIAMVLMLKPDLILLDEPTAGMNKLEKKITGELLQKISKYKSVLVVEHDMDFVKKYAESVTVMHEGQLLCQGSVEEVNSNQKVREVYLGESGDEIAATRTA